MGKPDHVVVCGEAPAPRRAKEEQILRLSLDGAEPNVDLEIIDITRRLSSDVPDVLTDLVEIASYVYCADQAITRGGEGVQAFGERWRRNFVFYVPVRLPSIWSSHSTVDALQRTLGLLSDDNYSFHFSKRTHQVPMQQYLKFDGEAPAVQELDEVLLFSGGVDSLGGTVKEAVLDRRRVALVSHRSNPKVFSRQKKLVEGLRLHCQQNAPLHVPVWVHQRGAAGHEYTQRARTFLYSSLAVAVAHVFGLDRIRFYENGVVGLNLPISEQVVGARATRTTHPQVLSGFSELFSALVGQTFTVENPFLWLTKTEVFDLIGDAGCGDLIQDSVSCMHTREQTKEQPHCGQCSQCVSRRFAALASRYATDDPRSQYKVDLLTGPRLPKKDLTLVESFIRFATQIGAMNELQIVERFGEVGRILRHLRPLSSNEVAERIVQLHRRHSSEVARVMDAAIAEHASDIREEKLPKTCAIILAVPHAYRTVAAGVGADESQSVAAGTAKRLTTGAGDGSVIRSAGRRADADGNRRIAKLLEPFGSDWRNHLAEVCETIDNEKIPLPARSKKWMSEGYGDWADAMAYDREGFVKALQHRLEWVAKHPAKSTDGELH